CRPQPLLLGQGAPRGPAPAASPRARAGRERAGGREGRLLRRAGVSGPVDRRLPAARDRRATGDRATRGARPPRHAGGGAGGARAEHDLPAPPAGSRRAGLDGRAGARGADLRPRARERRRDDPGSAPADPRAMSPPLITVIIGAYDAERYLGEAIESVLAQTHPNFELIVVDDGSTDRTGEIAESYGEPVRCIRQANGGMAAARNRAIPEARGSFLAFL